MTVQDNRLLETAPPTLLEGSAHVVEVAGSVAWLEPEQTASCGACASSTTCGAKGMGTLASRIEARRFPLPNPMGLVVGEKVVVGFEEDSLVTGAFIAYGIPLATMWGAGAVAQGSIGRDAITMLAMFAGLALGLGVARLSAARMFAHGKPTLQFLRRAGHSPVFLPLQSRSDR